MNLVKSNGLLLLGALASAASACSGSDGGSAAAGGSGPSAHGGSVNSGGLVGSGGATNSGGHAPGSGGKSGSGGAMASGGANATAGAGGLGAGGTSAGASSGGRTSGSGGSTPSGGAGAGGSAARGGAGGSAGGAPAAGSGGISAGGAAGAVGTVTLTPGTVWNDTQGKVLQAHGEGIIQVDGTYYLIGEDKTNGAPFQNVKCYSSRDLKNWTFVNNLLTRQASGDLGPNRIIERPHVIYNGSTSQYVMYMHVDNSSYTDRKAGVATSSSVCGSYSYVGSVKPLGHDSLDDTLFQDGTTGYFLSEDRTNTKLQIYQLSDDYLSVSSLVTSLPQYESPAVVKIGDTYYIFGSHLTGWSTNDNQYSTATSMKGPWSSWKSFAPSGTSTCNSQVTFVLPVVGTTTTSYVFLGDRWNSSNLTDSRYIWQPLTINGTTVSMTCPTSWSINASTGVVSLSP